MKSKEALTRRSLTRRGFIAGAFEVGAIGLGIDSYRNFDLGSRKKAAYDRVHPDTPSKQQYQTAEAALTPQAEMTIDANGHGIIVVPNAAEAQKEVTLYEARQDAIKPHYDKATTELVIALTSATVGGVVFFHKPDDSER